MVVLEQLRGRAISMRGLQRTRKLHMIREYLLSEEGRRWHTVVYADALDVIAGTGSEQALRATLRRLGAGDGGQLVASAEPACWLGEACSVSAVRTMRRLRPEHFGTPHAPFPCTALALALALALTLTLSPSPSPYSYPYPYPYP